MRILKGLFTAALLFTSAATAAADFGAAMDAYRQGDYETAFKGFMEGAVKGDDFSQHNVSVMFYRGEGVKRDPARAFAWMTLAAQGDEPTILRSYAAMVILTDSNSISRGRQLAQSLAARHGLRLESERHVSGLRVVGEP